MVEFGVATCVVICLLGLYYYRHIRPNGPFKPLDYPIFTMFLVSLISNLLVFGCVILENGEYDLYTLYNPPFRTKKIIIDIVEFCIICRIIVLSKRKK